MTKNDLGVIEILVRQGQALLRDAHSCTPPNDKDSLAVSIRARLSHIAEDKLEALLRIIAAGKAAAK